ncbi:hypothetical protein NPX79_03685 [Spiroplasma endosymbiont of Anurida maritima]|uniref:hypothetical protein n=1 Tax=Spiroplasma endosymbiont of Anurida maritima TaxID=2967972 RepID=UPI0036D3CFBC
MQYIKGKISTANRIKTNNTNEEKTSEEVILNNIRTERTRILNSKLDIFKKNIEDNKVKTGDEIDKNKDVSEEKENNEEVTLSKENFEKIIFETINDVVESVGLDIFSIVTKYKKDIEK